MSRTELAATHKLDKTTISQIVAELIEQGIVGVQEIDTSIQRPGRKSELLTVSDDWGIVAGIELRPDGIRACATDMHANVIAAHHHRQLVERTTLRDAFMNSLEGLQADDRVDGRPLVGVGVGLSGIVNAQLQSIVKSIPLNILDPYDFREQISRHVRVPVLVDNDANCGAWSELVHDGDQRSSNFMFVLIEFRTPPQREHYGGDIGVGFGFVIDGSVYYGGSGAAGEFRSLYWHPGYRNQLAVPDAEAHEVLDKPDVLPRVIEELASHVGVFANVLDLGAVYVGGDVSTIKDLVLGSFYSAIQNNWPYDEERDCVVELASLEDDIVAVGAASMVLEHIFQEPVLPAGLRARNRVWQTILSARAAAPVPRRSP